MWFRQDLRLADNPALAAACDRGAIIPVYILDDQGAGEHAMGAASRWWLHQALEDLNNSLRGGLQVYRGDALTLLSELVEQTGAGAVLWRLSAGRGELAAGRPVATLPESRTDVCAPSEPAAA